MYVRVQCRLWNNGKGERLKVGRIGREGELWWDRRKCKGSHVSDGRFGFCP